MMRRKLFARVSGFGALAVVPIVTGLGAVALTGCGSGGGDGGGGGGTSGTGGSGGGTPAGCNLDFTRLTSHATVSLTNDVMPIFGLSCVASSCHDKDSPIASLYLGPHCTPNVTTKVCEYATTDPLTATEVTNVWTNLVGFASKTAPAVMRVAAGDPANSFLLQKTSNTQSTHNYACMPQDPGATGCGDEMPPGATLCTQNNGQERWDTIAAWIQQGAPNN